MHLMNDVTLEHERKKNDKWNWWTASPLKQMNCEIITNAESVDIIGFLVDTLYVSGAVARRAVSSCWMNATLRTRSSTTPLLPEEAPRY